MFICHGCQQSVKGSKQHKVVTEKRSKVYRYTHPDGALRKETVGSEIAKEKNLCDECHDYYIKFGRIPAYEPKEQENV